MAIPNYVSVVEECKKLYPQDWKDAHTGNANTEGFIRKLVPMLQAKDLYFGLNGKRGNPADISDDAVNYLCDAKDSEGRTPDGDPCVVIDVIVGAGGPNPQPGWSVFNTKVEGSGAWVDPSASPVPPQPVPPPTPTYPYPDENTTVKAFQERVRKAYSDAGRAFPDPNDSDAFRHFCRYGYSCHEMDEPKAADKHIAELRKDLGLPS